jgi:hypothetical protein
VVINEIMYNPVVPAAGFVELFNTSVNFAFDLTGWRFNGLDYTFPEGSFIAPRRHLVLVQDRRRAAVAYGTNFTAFDEFDGNLDLDGETLTLLKPGDNGAPDLVIDKVRYEARQPWPTEANGAGPSLQVIDAAQDNSRPSNWLDVQVWRQFKLTGNTGNTNAANPVFRLIMFLDAAGGSIYLDDIYLVQGTVAEAGVNRVRNGDFESLLSGPWVVSTNNAPSAISTEVAHSGSGSLRYVNLAGGNVATNRSIWQDLPDVATNTVHTLSFWYLSTATGTNLTIRTAPGSFLTPIVNVRPVVATPGAANSVAGSLPAYDPLWLNELQPDNTTGPSDNFGEREPWVELYNAGSTPLDLSGYYLANNYNTNLTQWPFPAGSSIGAGEFKLIWADGEPGETAGTSLHTSFRLNNTTGSVALVRLVGGQPQITDYLTYSGVGPGLSYGDYPDGQPFSRFIMRDVTPGGTNITRFVNLYLNEWLAGNTNTIADPADLPDLQYEDWFEIYNAGTNAVDLGGYFLTDNPGGNTNQYSRVPNNGRYVIPAGGFLLVWADNEPAQNNPERIDLHVNFALGKSGDSIALYAPDGRTLIDRVDFGQQIDDIAQGRYPDGALTTNTLAMPTPRGPNILNNENTAPVIAVIGTKTATLGQSFAFTVSASDAQASQTLTFSIVSGAPGGATIHPDTGLFSWSPPFSMASSTNAVTVGVTDNGAPALSDTETFTLLGLPPPPTLSITGNQISLGFQTVPGKTYRVEYKDDLGATQWQRLNNQDYPAGAASSLTVSDLLNQPQRFYRIVQLD